MCVRETTWEGNKRSIPTTKLPAMLRVQDVDFWRTETKSMLTSTALQFGAASRTFTSNFLSIIFSLVHWLPFEIQAIPLGNRVQPASQVEVKIFWGSQFISPLPILISLGKYKIMELWETKTKIIHKSCLSIIHSERNWYSSKRETSSSDFLYLCVFLCTSMY